MNIKQLSSDGKIAVDYHFSEFLLYSMPENVVSTGWNKKETLRTGVSFLIYTEITNYFLLRETEKCDIIIKTTENMRCNRWESVASLKLQFDDRLVNA